MGDKTIIQLEKPTVELLKQLKICKGQSYNDVILMLISFKKDNGNSKK